ncbi:MAG: hypothetical protein FWD26_05235 [Treponema sp.]|nr:hypothetical protein [Treponema sp.]
MKKEQISNNKASRSLLRTVCSLFFVLCSLLITSCSDPFAFNDEPHITPPENLPPGHGWITFSVAGNKVSRNIVPETLYESDISLFVLTFTGAEKGTIIVVKIDGNDYINEVPIFLEEDEWSLSVEAYLYNNDYVEGENDEYLLVARGEYNGTFTITAGAGESITVNLNAILDGEPGGKGLFSWDLQFGAFPTIPMPITATMTLQTLTGIDVFPPVDLMTGVSSNLIQKRSSMQINIGYYQVEVKISFKPEDEIEDFVYFAVVYIYLNLESIFKLYLNEDYFNLNFFVVTFMQPDGTEPKVTVLPFTPITEARAVAPIYKPITEGLYLNMPYPVPANNDFLHWWSDIDDDENISWDMDNRIVEDRYMTLFPKWKYEPINITGSGSIADNALDYVNENAVSGDRYTLLIDGDVSVRSFTGGLGPIQDVHFLLAGLGEERKVTQDGYLDFASLKISDFILGANITFEGLVYGYESVFKMLTGSKIAGSTKDSGYASAVFLNRAKFIMEGGTITGNTYDYDGNGGAVYLEDSEINMSGGSITGNTGGHGDVVLSNFNKLSLSGSAVIGKIAVLYSSSFSNPIEIDADWSGTIGTLDLFGDAGDWKDVQILATGTSPAIIARINGSLGYFNGSLSTPIKPKYEINANGVLVEAEIFNFMDKINEYRDGSDSMAIYVPHDITLEDLNVFIPAKSGDITLTIKSKPCSTHASTENCEDCTFTIFRGRENTSISETDFGGLFIVGNGARLILENIIIDGGYEEDNSGVPIEFTDNQATLVKVNSGGHFTMRAGAVLQNNRASIGGAVYLIDGTFIMDGGTITGNLATGNSGGVYIAGSGTSGKVNFTMTGGQITGNTAKDENAPLPENVFKVGGGVTVTYSAVFNMHGGRISDNTAGDGGGIHMSDNGTVNIYNGVISGNDAKRAGGGINITGTAERFSTVNMYDGKISGNTASNGGGIFVVDSEFNMSGGLIGGDLQEDANKAVTSGGGVAFFELLPGNQGRLILGGTAKIFGNTNGATTPVPNNVHLANGKFITIGTSAPNAGMQVNVNNGDNNGVFVQNGADESHAQYFHADDTALRQVVSVTGGRLALAIKVNTPAGLQGVENNLSAHYIQTDNIPMSGVDFTPIGPGNFTGSFNGNGLEITNLNLYFDDPAAFNIALFRSIGNGGVIKNVRLVEVQITSSFTGGIAGTNSGTIDNCFVSGRIDVLEYGTAGGIVYRNSDGGTVKNCNTDVMIVGLWQDGSLGGIAGFNNGVIKNSYSTGNITGDSNTTIIGGITGQLNGGVVANCYSTGKITGSGSVGGIVGSMSQGIIENCFSTGDIEGDVGTGGVVGYISRNDNVIVQNCYTISNVKGASSVGGLFGSYSGSTGTPTITNNLALNRSIASSYDDIGRIVGSSLVMTLSNNYAWDEMQLTVNGAVFDPPDNLNNGTNLTAAQIMTESQWTTPANWNTTTGSTWDFTDTWQWNGGSYMPSLKGVGNPQPWPEHFVN